MKLGSNLNVVQNYTAVITNIVSLPALDRIITIANDFMHATKYKCGDHFSSIEFTFKSLQELMRIVTEIPARERSTQGTLYGVMSTHKLLQKVDEAIYNSMPKTHVKNDIHVNSRIIFKMKNV